MQAMSPPRADRAAPSLAAPSDPADPAAQVAQAAEAEAPARAPLTPEAWLAAATDLLEVEGIDAVRVDALARKLGVTRGSFYWHFKDREDLLRGVLQAWRDAATSQLTQRLKDASAQPAEQLRDVLSLPFRGRSAQRASRIELAIRAWARRDALARRFVDECDAARLGYIAQIFSGLGFAPAEARSRAMMAYCMDVAGSLITPVREASADDADWLRSVERVLSAPS